jgi:hypothetical protein
VAILKKRERIVSFRVSDDEYESLRSASEKEGAHSISEYARRAACAKQSNSAFPDLQDSVKHLHTRVDELQDEMRRIVLRIERLV